MNCFTHAAAPAVGTCGVCGKAICRECVARESPRLLCTTCISKGVLYGFEYKSETKIGEWPLVHICMGIDPATFRPKIAKGVIAAGNIAIGGIAFGGASFGLITFGGFSVGILLAIGGAALGLGLSLGGFALGSVAFGGLAIGFDYAVGGLAMARHAIDGQHCDPAAREFLARWLPASSLPPACGQ
ncbi:MAG: hypothetical protein AB1405_02545 [Bdellovibrionota bacterium]